MALLSVEQASLLPWIPETECIARDGAPSPAVGETYQDYLKRCGLLDHGFVYREVVDHSKRREEPPMGLWSNLPLSLAVAIELRRQALRCGAVRGVRVVAAYRPVGGARRSRHKSNRALDLDRIGGDSAAWYELAVRMWSGLGAEFSMGLGLYTSARARGGMRIHVDTGTTARSWQGVGTGFGKPWKVDGRPTGLAVSIANRLGLPVPTGADR